MKTKITLMVLMLSFINAFSQKDSIDTFIESQMMMRKIPGLQLAIIKKNRIVKLNSYGVANIEDSIAVDNETIFSINSITKAFVGVSVMQLVEQGRLDLNVEIKTYLTDIPKKWQSITLKQLLTHTSGLPHILSNDTGGLISEKGIDVSWEIVKSLPMISEPNAKFKYNQLGYILIGKIIDKVYGISFTDYIIKNQLQKVGMKRTEEAGFSNLNDVVRHSAKRYTFYYGQNISNIKSEFYPSILQTAAGMGSTSKEIANWIIALQTGMLFNQKSSLDLLWKPALLNNGETQGFNNLLNGYALGWPTVSRSKHPAIAAVGGNRAGVFVYPNDDLSVVVLTNLMGALPSKFIDEIAGYYIPDMKEKNGFGLPDFIKMLWKELELNGYKESIVIARQLQKNKKLKFDETNLNSWGYKLIESNNTKKALEIFKLNVHLFPKSGNAFDSLAEVYALLGLNTEAIKNYETALRLNPDNINAEKQIKKLNKINSKNN
ncbi:serine hydrolase domain-containing protein [Tenacibaculum ovolyticum]|uniref:serine hydrolase domain-containing protein n=1 Tax=Tenacibaculum ovolyticum TaxID=104270 RepID=UPI001F33B926|nr:serine hydrolase domain-containing protein [Tenacibaculum ovolyticum]